MATLTLPFGGGAPVPPAAAPAILGSPATASVVAADTIAANTAGAHVPALAAATAGTRASAPTIAPAGADPAELSPGKKIFAFAVMCVGFFIALLDIQIVAA